MDEEYRKTTLCVDHKSSKRRRTAAGTGYGQDKKPAKWKAAGKEKPKAKAVESSDDELYGPAAMIQARTMDETEEYVRAIGLMPV